MEMGLRRFIVSVNAVYTAALARRLNNTSNDVGGNIQQCPGMRMREFTFHGGPGGLLGCKMITQ